MATFSRTFTINDRPAMNWNLPCIPLGCVSTEKGLGLLKNPPRAASLLELRVDTMLSSGVSLDAISRALAQRCLPALLTPRSREEGGSIDWAHGRREEVFRKLLPSVDAIDIEAASIQPLLPIAIEARAKDIRLVLSRHSISQPITRETGERWISEFRQIEADFYKIAAWAQTQADVHVLARLLLDHPTLPLAVMAVGPMARVSRQALPGLGSRLVYGYADEPAAPDQPSIEEVQKGLAGIVSNL